jgi:rod shape-determining protein MreD
VKAAGTFIAILVALALQTTVVPFLWAGKSTIDLVLVVVVYAALQFGPTAGILAGAIAGMSQDALSGGIIGVAGLAKTIVGFLAGTLASQFIVTNFLPRFVVLLLGAALNAICILGLYAVIDRHGLSIPWRTAWPQMLLTAFVGIILIQAVQAVPGILMRRRLRRGY